MTSVDYTTDFDITRLKSGILDAFGVGFPYLVSDLNIWDYPLTKSDMELWTSCR